MSGLGHDPGHGLAAVEDPLEAPEVGRRGREAAGGLRRRAHVLGFGDGDHGMAPDAVRREDRSRPDVQARLGAAGQGHGVAARGGLPLARQKPAEIEQRLGPLAAQGSPRTAEQGFGGLVGVGDLPRFVHGQHAREHRIEDRRQQRTRLVLDFREIRAVEPAFDFPHRVEHQGQGAGMVGRGRPRNVETAPDRAQRIVDGGGGAAPGVVALAVVFLGEDLQGHARDQGGADGVGADRGLGPVGARAEIEPVGGAQGRDVAHRAHHAALGIGHGDEQVLAGDGGIGPLLDVPGQLLQPAGEGFELFGGGEVPAAARRGVHLPFPAAPPGLQQGRVGQLAPEIPGFHEPLPLPVMHLVHRRAVQAQRGLLRGRGLAAAPHGPARALLPDGEFVSASLQCVHDASRKDGRGRPLRQRAPDGVGAKTSLPAKAPSGHAGGRPSRLSFPGVAPTLARIVPFPNRFFAPCGREIV